MMDFLFQTCTGNKKSMDQSLIVQQMRFIQQEQSLKTHQGLIERRPMRNPELGIKVGIGSQQSIIESLEYSARGTERMLHWGNCDLHNQIICEDQPENSTHGNWLPLMTKTQSLFGQPQSSKLSRIKKIQNLSGAKFHDVTAIFTNRK